MLLLILRFSCVYYFHIIYFSQSSFSTLHSCFLSNTIPYSHICGLLFENCMKCWPCPPHWRPRGFVGSYHIYPSDVVGTTASPIILCSLLWTFIPLSPDEGIYYQSLPASHGIVGLVAWNLCFWVMAKVQCLFIAKSWAVLFLANYMVTPWVYMVLKRKDVIMTHLSKDISQQNHSQLQNCLVLVRMNLFLFDVFRPSSLFWQMSGDSSVALHVLYDVNFPAVSQHGHCELEE